jgi:hypothetical protein
MKNEWLNIIDKEVGIKRYFLSSSHFSAQDRRRYYWTNIDFDKNNIKDKNLNFKDIEDKSADNYFNENRIEDLKNKSWNQTKTYILNSEKYMKSKFPTLWGANMCPGNVPFIKKDDKYRLLTILECERLQTLPDNYTYFEDLSNNDRYRTITNGWNVATINHILSGIIKK